MRSRCVSLLALFTLLAFVAATACTRPNPEYCEASSWCTADPSKPFCDVDGSHGGTRNLCIPTPPDPDAGTIADAAGIDAGCIPTTCEAEGKNCGELDDGCEGTLECGVCVLPLACGSEGTTNVCEGTCVSGEWTLDTADGTTAGSPTSPPVVRIGPDQCTCSSPFTSRRLIRPAPQPARIVPTAALNRAH